MKVRLGHLSCHYLAFWELWAAVTSPLNAAPNFQLPSVFTHVAITALPTAQNCEIVNQVKVM